VEHLGPFEDLGGGLALLDEIDGVFGEVVGLVGVLLEHDGGEAAAEESLHANKIILLK
jgi:hypothetical protein